VGEKDSEAEDSILDNSDFLLADMDINWCDEKEKGRIYQDFSCVRS
jgi:hypothetical protein